jgi:hypothetical protein
MEPYIKNDLSDITYLSELIPPFWTGSALVARLCQKGGINSQTLVISKRRQL